MGLLKADLLRRANRLDEAAAELDAAVKADPPPPEHEVLDVRLPVLAGQKKHAEAVAAIMGIASRRRGQGPGDGAASAFRAGKPGSRLRSVPRTSKTCSGS